MEVWHSWFEYSCIHVATAALAPGDVTTECSAIKIHDTRARKPVTLINIYVPPVRTSYGRNQGFNPDFLPGLPDTFILGDFNATWFLVLSVQVPGLTYLFIHVQQEGPKDMNTHTHTQTHIIQRLFLTAELGDRAAKFFHLPNKTQLLHLQLSFP